MNWKAHTFKVKGELIRSKCAIESDEGYVVSRYSPDGAEAFHPAAREQMACWYKRDSHGDVWCNLAEGAHVGIWTHMGGRRDFPIGAIARSKQ